MNVKGARCVFVVGVVWVLAAGCASQDASQDASPSASQPADTAPATASLESGSGEKSAASASRVLIQVEADCKVDVEEAHISESRNEEAHWQLNGHAGPLAIEFKEEKGRNALDVAASSRTQVAARIKLASQQGRHPYRIKIGDTECPDPVIIIDG